MEHRTRTRLVAALVLVSVFGSGVLLGYAADRGAAVAVASVTSDGGPSSTGETVSSGWPGARAKMSRPVMEPNVWRGTLAIRSAIVGAPTSTWPSGLIRPATMR